MFTAVLDLMSSSIFVSDKHHRTQEDSGGAWYFIAATLEHREIIDGRQSMVKIIKHLPLFSTGRPTRVEVNKRQGAN